MMIISTDNMIIFTYYEIVNTIDEYHTSVTAKWATFDLAKADMINHNNWYDKKGTGKINKVEMVSDKNGSIVVKRSMVYKNSYGEELIIME